MHKLVVASSCLGAILAAQDVPAPPSGYDPDLWGKASKLHHAAIVVDTHTDTTSRILDEGFDLGKLAPDGHMDLPRIAAGGLDAAFYSIYVAARYAGDERLPDPKSGDDATVTGRVDGSARRALSMIDGLLRTAARNPEQMAVCASTAELRAAVAAGKHAALMGIEGGHAIEGDLALLRMFGRLGVRYMTLTHTNHNQFADSCAQATPRWGGLNRLGVKVVQEMNRLGIMVDVSHVSDATFYDALRVTRAPVILSHSSCRALCPHPRNITDDMLRALAKNGGVIMINFNCGFVDPEYAKRREAWNAQVGLREKAIKDRWPAGSSERERAIAALRAKHPEPPRPKLAVLLAHLRHAMAVAGADHVGLGSDFDGVPCVPDGIDDVSYLPHLTYGLLAAGHSETDVVKVLGGNLLRVFARVEEVAATLHGEPPAANDPATDALAIDR